MHEEVWSALQTETFGTLPADFAFLGSSKLKDAAQGSRAAYANAAGKGEKRFEVEVRFNTRSPASSS